jgi:hypothetical protein
VAGATRGQSEYTLIAPEPGPRWYRDIGLRLYRQVIEIRDGQLVVRAYADPTALTHAQEQARQAGLPTEIRRATAEAPAIASGLAGKASGRPRRSAQPAQLPGGTDLTTEIAWLRCVSRAFAHSAIVRELRETTLEQR